MSSAQFVSSQKVHRFISEDLTLRIASVDATQAVQHMQKLQNTYPIASVGLGRGMVGALLLAAHLNEGQQLGLLFRGDGPLRSLYTEATFEGHVRAYTPHPDYQPVDYSAGLKVGPALGNGTLSVSRHLPFQKQPFHGTVELTTGEVGEDLAHYLQQSHQIRSLISLGVYLDPNGRVTAAGGVLIEVMPGVNEEVVEKVQANQDRLRPHISKILVDGGKPTDLVAPFLEGISYQQIPHDYFIEYNCPCTKERVLRALETLGAEDLLNLSQERSETAITCQVCGQPYLIKADEIKELSEVMSGKKVIH